MLDEGVDCGGSLVIRCQGIGDGIDLPNIMNVAPSVAIDPLRITLRLRRPCRLGGDVVFSPILPVSLNPFAKIPTAEQHILRVDLSKEKAETAGLTPRLLD